MPTWTEFATAAPELAERVRASLQAHTHLTIATLRKDGSPRISGTEVQFEDGELWIGSMPNALKAKDLLRDPRYALHSGSDEPDEGLADAKVAGHAQAVPHPEHHRFRLDVCEASIVSLDDAKEHLIIDIWTADGGVKQIKRK